MISKKKFEEKIQVILNNFKVGNFDNTISQIKKLLLDFPNNEYLLNLLGLAFQKNNNLDKAEITFEKLLKINPSNIVAQNNYANLLKLIGQIAKSKEIFEKIIQKEPNYIPALNNLANLNIEIEKYDNSIPLFKKILQIMESQKVVNKKQKALIHYNLSACYVHLRDKGKSLDHANIALENDNHISAAYNTIVSLIDFSKEDRSEIILKMNRIINDENISHDVKTPVYFALGKAYEDMGNYDLAFKNYNLGNNLYSKFKKYDFKKDEEIFNIFKETFSNEKILSLRKKAEKNKRKYIFVCGMPRSGTTLAEKIISTHNKVASLGEVNWIEKIVKKNFSLNQKLYEQLINFFNKDHNQIVKEYESVFNLLDFKENISTDKSLFNYIYIGFLKVFFPNSKIIILQREYKNNFLSIFKNFLPTIKWSSEISNIKKNYDLFNQYIELWKELYSDEIYTLKYENLVDNTEKEVKDILKFCELEWDPNCLEFHKKNKSPIKTASWNQANQPIYQTSKDKYSLFEKYFK